MMFVKKIKRPNGSTTIQIVDNKRVGDKVVQKVIRHMGQWITEKEITQIVTLAESVIIEMKNIVDPVLPGLEDIFHRPQKKMVSTKPDEAMVSVAGLVEESRIHKGVDDVFGFAFEQLELMDSIATGYKTDESNAIFKEVVLSRLSGPVSKRKTALNLEMDKEIKIPLEKIYRMMDKVHDNEERIKKKICDQTLSLFNQKIDVAFFDVTTLYFESFTPDELRSSGFSKDNKFKETQVMLALITTTEGLPIGYELFPGNTYEGNTLIRVVEQIERNYDIANMFIVADRAMFTRSNLDKLSEMKVKFIVAAKLKTLNKTFKNAITDEVQEVLKANPDLEGWTKDFEYEGRRLVVNYSKKRAHKDEKDRTRLVERITKKMKNGEVRLSDLINNTGTKKYLKLEKKGAKTATLNDEKILNDSLWDGIHGVITNHNEADLKSEQILEKYRGLWQIEAAFRVNKHDLRMRPIFHWVPHRIKAHILICFVAYSLTTFIKHKLLKKNVKLSFEKIKDELNRLQFSIVRDEKSKNRFILPSKLTKNQIEIYTALGLKRDQKAKIIL